MIGRGVEMMSEECERSVFVECLGIEVEVCFHEIEGERMIATITRFFRLD
jgi:hypothetical protein